MNALMQSIRNFAREDDGAQVVEYALIIAVISIGLVIALDTAAGFNFAGFVTRVNTCLTTATCT